MPDGLARPAAVPSRFVGGLRGARGPRVEVAIHVLSAFESVAGDGTCVERPLERS